MYNQSRSVFLFLFGRVFLESASLSFCSSSSSSNTTSFLQLAQYHCSCSSSDFLIGGLWQSWWNFLSHKSQAVMSLISSEFSPLQIELRKVGGKGSRMVPKQNRKKNKKKEGRTRSTRRQRQPEFPPWYPGTPDHLSRSRSYSGCSLCHFHSHRRLPPHSLHQRTPRHHPLP